MSMQSFDDFEYLFAQMWRDQEAADQNVQAWQAAIEPGDYVYRPGPGFYVFSEILPDPERRDEQLKYFRFTRSYSIACEHGELGDVHVSTIEGKMSDDEFNKARNCQWEYSPVARVESEIESRRIYQFSQINTDSAARENLESNTVTFGTRTILVKILTSLDSWRHIASSNENLMSNWVL